MKKILILFFLINATLYAQTELNQQLQKWNKNKVPYITVDSFASLKTNPVLLDAREEKEFKISHLKKAVFVGYDHFKLKETLKKLPKDKDVIIVVYCSLGIRSEIVAHKLIKEGYTNVYNLYGGIFEWKNNAFRVIDTLGNNTEKVHTYNKDWSKWLTKGEKVYE
jgi:rhodanese-related sulfurtransferase